jgi:hypothetical protein
MAPLKTIDTALVTGTALCPSAGIVPRITGGAQTASVHTPLMQSVAF